MNRVSLGGFGKASLWLLGMLLAAIAAAADPADGGQAASNSIRSLDYTTLPGGRLVIRVGLKQALQNPPAGFTISNPARIALDFPDTANGLGKNQIGVGEGPLRAVNIAQSGSRTRLVLNLSRPVGYETRMDGSTVLITLQGSETVAGGVAARFAEAPPGAPQHSLRAVDFRRGKNGEGRVLVDLSDTTTGIDIRLQGKTIVVDFINTSLPQNLERRLDVLDFGTPVRAVETTRQGNNVRLVIEPGGQWEHSAYQTDRQFIIEVRPIAEDPNKLVQGSRPGYAGEKLSLNFQNVEVRSVLQVIADFTGLNIITSESVTGNLTLRLKDVPWDQALDIILNAKGLDKRKNGNVIWVAPREELASREKQELEARQKISELEPLQTEYYALNYLRADQAKNILTGLASSATDGSGEAKCEIKAEGLAPAAAAPGAAAATTSTAAQQILSKRGNASYELKTNTLIVSDAPSKHEEIRKLLNVIDVPAKQVMIEARMVIADDKFSKALGARFGVQAGNRAGDFRSGVSGDLTSSSAIAGGGAPGGGGNLNLSLPAVLGAATSGSLALTLVSLGSGNLINLELSALEADNRGKIISSPRVVTANQRPAVIAQGVELPVTTAGTTNTPATTTYKQVLMCLLVNPQILNNDALILDVEVLKNTKGEAVVTSDGSINFAVNTNRVKTQVLVNNGDTAVLGGIFEQETRNDKTQLPLFGNLPVLGALFRSTLKQDDKKELLIFITPRIVKDSLNIR